MDILIDPYRFTIAAPACAEQLVMTKQTQSFGGTPVGDGFPQSGPAVAARASFLSGLQSHVTANMQHVLPNTSVIYTPGSPLSLWSGLGSLAGKSEPGSPGLVNTYVTAGAANGRFNTSANSAGNYVETDYGFDITLSSARTAFTCYVTDMGDANSVEVEFRFWNGAALQRILYMPVVNVTEKPSSNEAMCVAYADGSRPFTRVEVILNTFHDSYDDADFVGFDDLAVGNVVTCIPATSPQEFYGINTGVDAAKTVTGPALTARNAWVAASTNRGVCDFESATVGLVAGASLSIPFAGPLASYLSGATLQSTRYTGFGLPVSHARATATVDAIANSAGSARWNTTSGGSKWYEWTDELKVTLPQPATAVGFYFTDLGDRNATLRITLLRPGLNGGVVYYVPKAAQLASPAGLLRFWGVTGEQQFDRVVIQTVYYATLTAHEYIAPAIIRSALEDMVGIDDLMFAL
jgi:hypothetical protein